MQTNVFKTAFLKMFFSTMLLIFSLTSLSAQDNSSEDLYFEIACFKAKDADAVNYFNYWGKAIHEEMIRQKILIDWKLFRVDYPNGSDCDCNYRAVRIFRGIQSLDKIKSEKIRTEIVGKLWPWKSLKEIRGKFQKSIEFKHAEVYRLNDALIPHATNSELVVVNFMDVKREDRKTYLEMEKDVFKPMHEQSSKEGKLVDWFVAEHVIPFGSNIETDYITVDKFNNYDAFFNASFADLFKKVHPDKDFESTMNKMGEVRKLIKAEIWRSITVADVEKPQTTAASSGNQ